MADGNFNITGNGVEGEGTFSVSNGTAEFGLHMVVGEMAQKQEVVIAGDKAAVNSLKTTSLSDHTETELTFTKEGMIFSKIHYFFIWKKLCARLILKNTDITTVNIISRKFLYNYITLLFLKSPVFYWKRKFTAICGGSVAW